MSLPRPYPLRIRSFSFTSYGDLGRLQIRQVQHVATHYTSVAASLSSFSRARVAEVFLAASHFDSRAWKLSAINLVKSIIAVEPVEEHLQMWANLRAYTLASLESRTGTRDFMLPKQDRSQGNPRSNALRGSFLLAYATDLIRRDCLDRAWDALNQFSSFSNEQPSTMEYIVLKQKEIKLAIINRYRGHFSAALEVFSIPPTEGYKTDEMTACSRMSHKAGVLCEVGQPDQALKFLKIETDMMLRLHRQNTAGGRCLRLSLAEVLLQGNRLDDSSMEYRGLKEAYQGYDPNIVTGMGKLRLNIGLARISHLKEEWRNALILWHIALCISVKYGWQEGFIEMVIRYSLAHVMLMLGDQEESRRNQREAEVLYEREARRYWITCLGTQWLDYVRHALGHG